VQLLRRGVGDVGLGRMMLIEWEIGVGVGGATCW
jgi:hypothetical protein